MHDDEHVAEILGRGAKQTRSTDIDLFDQPVERRVGVIGRLPEGIQVDDDEIDRLDPLRAR